MKKLIQDSSNHLTKNIIRFLVLIRNESKKSLKNIFNINLLSQFDDYKAIEELRDRDRV